MKCVLLVFVLVALTVESRCDIRKYEWDKKDYYCGDQILDIMSAACIHKLGDYVWKVPRNRPKRATLLEIADACCPSPLSRSDDPTIDGCTINEMLENFCTHPERVDRSKVFLTVNESSTSNTKQILKIENTTRPPSTTTTFTTTNSTTSTPKIKRPNCNRIIKTFYNRGIPGWYTTKDTNCTITMTNSTTT